MQAAGIPVLACNLDTSREPALDGLVQRFTLLELPTSNLTVGVVGLTATDTSETSNPGAHGARTTSCCHQRRYVAYAHPTPPTRSLIGPAVLPCAGTSVSFLPYNETLPGCVADARAAGADLVVLLSHIGYDQDLILASSPAGAGVDLIVGAPQGRLAAGCARLCCWRRLARAPHLPTAACLPTCSPHTCRRAHAHAAVGRARAGRRDTAGRHPARAAGVSAHQRNRGAGRPIPHPGSLGRRAHRAHRAGPVCRALPGPLERDVGGRARRRRRRRLAAAAGRPQLHQPRGG